MGVFFTPGNAPVRRCGRHWIVMRTANEQRKALLRAEVQSHTKLNVFQQIESSFPLLYLPDPRMRNAQLLGDRPHAQAFFLTTVAEPANQGAIPLVVNRLLHERDYIFCVPMYPK